jgi:hypothetical protein
MFPTYYENQNRRTGDVVEQDSSSVRLPTQGNTYPQRRFGRSTGQNTPQRYTTHKSHKGCLGSKHGSQWSEAEVSPLVLNNNGHYKSEFIFFTKRFHLALS